jgi:hypothetical protein
MFPPMLLCLSVMQTVRAYLFMYAPMFRRFILYTVQAEHFFF